MKVSFKQEEIYYLQLKDTFKTQENLSGQIEVDASLQWPQLIPMPLKSISVFLVYSRKDQALMWKWENVCAYTYELSILKQDLKTTTFP